MEIASLEQPGMNKKKLQASELRFLRQSGKNNFLVNSFFKKTRTGSTNFERGPIGDHCSERHQYKRFMDPRQKVRALLMV